MPLPPADEDADAKVDEPKLNFSNVECLIFAFHYLARFKEDFFTEDDDAAARLKDFRIRYVR